MGERRYVSSRGKSHSLSSLERIAQLWRSTRATSQTLVPSALILLHYHVAKLSWTVKILEDKCSSKVQTQSV